MTKWKDLTREEIEQIYMHAGLEGLNISKDGEWIDDDGNLVTLQDINNELHKAFDDINKYI